MKRVEKEEKTRKPTPEAEEETAGPRDRPCQPTHVGPRAASLLSALLARKLASPEGEWIHAYALAAEVGVPYQAAWLLLKALEANELAESQTVFAPGTRRKRRVYRLTSKGAAYASEVLAEFHRREVRKRARSRRKRQARERATNDALLNPA